MSYPSCTQRITFPWRSSTRHRCVSTKLDCYPRKLNGAPSFTKCHRRSRLFLLGGSNRQSRSRSWPLYRHHGARDTIRHGSPLSHILFSPPVSDHVYDELPDPTSQPLVYPHWPTCAAVCAEAHVSSSAFNSRYPDKVSLQLSFRGFI